MKIFRGNFSNYRMRKKISWISSNWL